jgi:hypothetical protein
MTAKLDELLETYDWIRAPIDDFIDTITKDQVVAMQKGELPEELKRYYLHSLAFSPLA